MFPGTILDLSSSNDDIVYFDFLWGIINTIYFNVVTRYKTMVYETM